MKKLIALISAVLLMFTSIPFVMTATAEPEAKATTYKNELVLSIDGYDCHTDGKDIVIYTNNTSSPKTIMANTYYFRHTKVMVFMPDGRLMEAGGDLYEDTGSGTPQGSVTIPAGGFMVGFNPYNETKLFSVFNIAMEDAMLFNTTMSIIYDMNGSYDKSTNKFTIRYNDPVEPSKDAIKFLFVGNSSTYYNGVPLKFKAMAEAAGVEVDVDYCTKGSAYLLHFANAEHDCGIKFRDMLSKKKYDYVVLQDNSNADYQDSKSTMSILLPLIEANGAEALLYMRYSSNTNPAQRPISARRLYIAYTRIGLEHNLTVSPVASAFIICSEKYPEIRLHGDDNSHHSKEGSYLISLCWLYSYLGIDPVGNSYTADMDEDTVKHLQECAKLAIDEGYDFNVSEEELRGEENIYEYNGEYYANIAINKSYTTDGSKYDGKWAEHNSDGTLIGKYTDGIFAGATGDDLAIGCVTGTEINVDIDLGALYSVKAVRTNLYGATWGITDPTDPSVKVKVYVSKDGKTYTEYDNATAELQDSEGNWKINRFTIELGDNVDARYVRVTFINARFLWTDEICVFGEPSQTPEYVKGDVNGDGKINEYDYILVARAILGTYTLDETETLASDIDNNGIINEYDYILIARHHFGTYVIQ